ncbi:MAG: glycosyltransferase family 39 protein [Anaerolineae bacterium]|nr:glycosyltransferase family 39 protein [Anaerolineae bacterium]
MQQKTRQTRLATGTMTLLLIAASRLLLLADLSFDHDEVWSIWQTFGSPQEIIARTPFDWSPLFYLTLGAWRLLVGIRPIALRLSSVLAFMLSVALTYHLARKLFHSERAAWLSMLAYAGLGYVVYLSVLLRAYAVVMMLLPLGLILVLRYFERPAIKRGIVLGLLMATMFYLTLSAVFAFLVLGMFSLFLYPRNIWRWWLPSMTAFISAAVEIQGKIGMVATRTAVELNLILPPLPQAFIEIYQDYLGAAFWVWAALILLATVMIIINRTIMPQSDEKLKTGAHMGTPLRRDVIFRGKSGVTHYAQKMVFLVIVMWIVLSPLLLYAVHSRTNFFGARYSWWIALGIALWIGYGLSRLPKIASTIVGIVLIALLFTPQDIASYKERSPVFEQNFAWLAEHLQPGDVVMIDPECSCGRLEQWDYYMRVYFQNDVRLISEVSNDYQRIWYANQWARR